MTESLVNDSKPKNTFILPSDMDAEKAPLLNDRRDFLGACYGPTYNHRLLALLADDKPRFETPLPPDAERYMGLDDSLARAALINFINTSAAPVCSIEKDQTFINPKRIRHDERFGTCGDAERTLMDTFDYMRSAVDHADTFHGINDYGWTTLLNESSEPIAIRKQRGERSTLSLVPITIDGRGYPAGSLLQVRLYEDPMDDSIYDFKKFRGFTSYKNIKRIKFLRLSGFAHEPEERATIFHKIKFDRDSGKLTLAEITDLAQNSLSESIPFGLKGPSLMLKLQQSRFGIWLRKALE